jgi:hypothetical protein
MSLFDTKKGFYEWKAEAILAWDILKVAEQKIHPRSYEKMIRTTDEAIENIKPTEKTNLIWTKSGAVFGYRSQEPTEAINHVWEKATEVFGETKFSRLFVGSLLMWRISLRSEQWLTYASETGKYDPETGNEITERGYWINEKVKIQNTVDDLIAKFKGRR